MKVSGKILEGRKLKCSLGETTLGKFFFDCAKKYGDRISQIDASTDEVESYFSVHLRSVRVAIELQKRGLTSNDTVVVCSNNTIDNVIPIIASFYLGAKVVNLDPTLSIRNTKYLLTLVSPQMIFVEESSQNFIEESLQDTDLKPEIIIFGNSDKYSTFSDFVKPKQNEDKFEPVEVDIHETAVMFFSSGTTGLPKAICHSHYSFLKITEIARGCSFDASSIMHFTSFYWISAILILTQTYFEGGIRVFDREMDGEKTLKTIEKYKLTGIFLAPIYTYKLTGAPNLKRYDTSSLRCILTGGTPISTNQFKRLNDLFENATVVFGYGMTEVGMVSAFDIENEKHFIKTKTGSCGRTAPGNMIKVVSPDTDEILGPNQKGEIRIKSPGIMQGYYKVDSSDCFDSDGFLKTGDIGYYDEDECLYVVERIKEMFKYLSWHIVPSSIEAVLLEHPAVKETVVFGIPRGEEGEIPAACVVLNDNFNVDEEEIEKFVADRVADRERLRGGVTFVKALPKTPTGKLIRKEIRNIIIKTN